MALTDDLLKASLEIVSATWDPKDGRSVPDVDALALKTGAVSIVGSVMYADLANSTGLVDSCKVQFAAHVSRVFLYVAAQLIKHCAGAIRASTETVLWAYSSEKNTLIRLQRRPSC